MTTSSSWVAPPRATAEAPSRPPEVWDPVTGTFASAGAMADPREGHTATLLPDGRVLVAGGHDDRAALASTDVWDPATQTFVSSAGDR